MVSMWFLERWLAVQKARAVGQLTVQENKNLRLLLAEMEGLI